VRVLANKIQVLPERVANGSVSGPEIALQNFTEYVDMSLYDQEWMKIGGKRILKKKIVDEKQSPKFKKYEREEKYVT
jgi:hypothetical protein